MELCIARFHQSFQLAGLPVETPSSRSLSVDAQLFDPRDALDGAALIELLYGCNFPGHFLAKTYLDGEGVFIDCFNGGKILFEHDFKSVADDTYESIAEILNQDATTKIIIQRILNNLINAS